MRIDWSRTWQCSNVPKRLDESDGRGTIKGEETRVDPGQCKRLVDTLCVSVKKGHKGYWSFLEHPRRASYYAVNQLDQTSCGKVMIIPSLVSI